jgi:ferredoxin-type protein NapH
MASRADRRAWRRVVGLAAAVAFVALAASLVVWRATHQRGLALSIFGLGLSLGPCLAAYRLAEPVHKQAWRRGVMAAGGLAILAFSLLDAVSLDLEGFFALLFLGTMGVAVGHTLVTTIAGPLVFGRLLCGWGCWRAMVLESLPVGAGTGRRRDGNWGRLPLVGLALSTAAGALSAFAMHARRGSVPGRPGGESLVPIVIGVGVYYTLSIALAFALDDRRAFCKYLCPSGQLLRWTSRRSLVAIRAVPGRCTDCGACAGVCPMDIVVDQFARDGGRIGRGECILCQACVHACPSGALRMGLPGK